MPPISTAQAGAIEFWGADLPEDIRGDATLAKYTSKEAAARGLVSAVKMIGDRPENLIKRPEEGNPEALRGVLHQLGLPTDQTGYALKPVEGVTGHDSDLGKLFTSACYEAGVLPNQMQGVFEKVGSYLQQFEQQQAQARTAREEANMNTLRTELGAALDDTLARAESVLNHYGLVDAVNEAGLDSHPGFVKMVAEMFPSLQEDATGGRNEARGISRVKSPEEYRAEAKELQEKALFERNASKRQELSQAALRLYQLANAGK